MTTSDAYPQSFGRYRLVAPLARGGMGELHLAVTGGPGFRKLCVVKQILGHMVTQEYIERFVDEASVMVKLSHGNLVPVIECGEIEGTHFLAMEYVEGKDLRSVCNTLQARQQIFPLNLSLYLIKEICRGLSYAHAFSELELVHRDVSPPNVLLSYTGEVKLTDFGLALSALKVHKTAPGILLGKLAYMSPEQASGNLVDARADIYSAGLILWELLTGRKYFDQQENQMELLAQVMKPAFRAPSALNPEVPPDLDTVTRRALDPDRENRYPDAETLRTEVATILARLDPTTDASTMERFLGELYGDSIDKERNQRHQLLEGLDDQDLHDLPAAPAQAVLPREEELTAPLATDVMMAFEPGYVIDGKYRVEELIAEGGMGRVYRATHLGIERQVSLKILLQEFGDMSDVVERFRREARITSRIRHPHIVEVLDSGTTSTGQLYFAMELLEGTDLAQVLHAEKTLGINRVLRIGIQICDALEAAHESDVIHRDLKPENILLIPSDDEPDFVKIVDFGIAKIARSQGLTLPGLAVGTPEYMAPEQAGAQDCDSRADIYSLGVLLYELLVGEVPYSGSSYNEIIIKKASDPPSPPSERRTAIPEPLERLILQTLAYRPEDRPQTMAQMGFELRKILEGRTAAPVSAPNVSSGTPRAREGVSEGSPAPSTRRATILINALALLLGVALVLGLTAVVWLLSS